MGLGLNILNRNGFKRYIGNGIARFVDHIGSAVFSNLDGRNNVVQKGLGRYKIYDADDGGTLDSVFIQGRRDHNGQFPGNFADQRFRNIDVALHGLFYIFAVGIILSVKNTDAVQADNISALEIVHGGAFIDNGLLFFNRYIRTGQLRNTAGVHSDVLVSGKFLLYPFRCQNGRFGHHMFYGGHCAVVVGYDAGDAGCDLPDQNGQNET